MASTVEIHAKPAKEPPHLSPQNKRLIQYLEKRKNITPLLAWQFLGIYRLAARICELKEHYLIATEMVEQINKYQEKVHFAKYTLLGPKTEIKVGSE